MKRFLVTILALTAVQAAHACRITIINDTAAAIFAFDEGSNKGNVLLPGQSGFYGADKRFPSDKGRHPSITLYMPTTPEDTDLNKAYNITQIACAIHEQDKKVTVSSVIAGTYNKGMYSVTNFAIGMDILACCGHHGHMHVMEEIDDIHEIDVDKF